MLVRAHKFLVASAAAFLFLNVSLVSLAHEMLCAETLNPALQTTVPSAKQLRLTFQLGGQCAEAGFGIRVMVAS